jgi:hypothetical protein
VILPTPGRTVLVRTALGHLVPAVVTGSSDGGAVHVVAFSHEWPLTAARALRNVPALDSMPREAVYDVAWLWPPRVDAGADVGKVSRELERENMALTRALASLADRLERLETLARRVDALERKSHL